jgi:hypothetical protein
MDSNSRARVLYVGNRNYIYNLDGDNILDDSGRFLGVRSSAEGASAQKKSPLETLIGKAKLIDGTKLLIIEGDKLSRETYNLLTGKYLGAK